MAKEIGPIAKPRQIMIVSELPKTRSGKIMRRLLKDVAENREVGDVTTLADSSVMSLIQQGLTAGLVVELSRARDGPRRSRRGRIRRTSASAVRHPPPVATTSPPPGRAGAVRRRPLAHLPLLDGPAWSSAGAALHVEHTGPRRHGARRRAADGRTVGG